MMASRRVRSTGQDGRRFIWDYLNFKIGNALDVTISALSLLMDCELGTLKTLININASPEEALNFYEEAMMVEPENACINFYLGLTYKALND